MFGPLNVLKPNILLKFASTDTKGSVTTCWELQNGRMTVVRCHEPFEPRISIKRRTQQPVKEPLPRALKGEVTDQDQTSHINDGHRDVCSVGPQLYP